jgi:hypothetical protein
VPIDILPITRLDVSRSSKVQTRQLLKEDIDFYLDNKCTKLNARRLELLTEVTKLSSTFNEGVQRIAKVTYNYEQFYQLAK